MFTSFPYHHTFTKFLSSKKLFNSNLIFRYVHWYNMVLSNLPKANGQKEQMLGFQLRSSDWSVEIPLKKEIELRGLIIKEVTSSSFRNYQLFFIKQAVLYFKYSKNHFQPSTKEGRRKLLLFQVSSPVFPLHSDLCTHLLRIPAFTFPFILYANLGSGFTGIES